MASQPDALDFSEFIRTFASDHLSCPEPAAAWQFKKIGEASYSEVFGIGDVVLKVVPLILSPADERLEGGTAFWPEMSYGEDVLKEVAITKAVGTLHSGFVRLLRLAALCSSNRDADS